MKCRTLPIGLALVLTECSGLDSALRLESVDCELALADSYDEAAT